MKLLAPRQKLFPIAKIDFVLVYWEYLGDDHFATKNYLQSAHLSVTVTNGQQSLASCNSTEEICLRSAVPKPTWCTNCPWLKYCKQCFPILSDEIQYQLHFNVFIVKTK